MLKQILEDVQNEGFISNVSHFLTKDIGSESPNVKKGDIYCFKGKKYKIISVINSVFMEDINKKVKITIYVSFEDFKKYAKKC
jgi:hypothetical protein